MIFQLLKRTYNLFKKTWLMQEDDLYIYIYVRYKALY